MRLTAQGSQAEHSSTAGDSAVVEDLNTSVVRVHI
jgi:hypothetical protein